MSDECDEVNKMKFSESRASRTHFMHFLDSAVYSANKFYLIIFCNLSANYEHIILVPDNMHLLVIQP